MYWFWSEVVKWKMGKEPELDELDEELICVSIN